MNKEWLRNKAIKSIEAIICAVAAALVIRYLPDKVDIFSFLPSTLITIPRVYYIPIGIFLLIWLILPERNNHAPRMFMIGNPRRPEFVESHGVANHFGVKWKFQEGSDMPFNLSGEDNRVHVEGPFCPICDYKMDSLSISTWFNISSKAVWHCAECEKNYRRPKKYLYDERDVVVKLIENKLRWNSHNA